MPLRRSWKPRRKAVLLPSFRHHLHKIQENGTDNTHPGILPQRQDHWKVQPIKENLPSPEFWFRIVCSIEWWLWESDFTDKISSFKLFESFLFWLKGWAVWRKLWIASNPFSISPLCATKWAKIPTPPKMFPSNWWTQSLQSKRQSTLFSSWIVVPNRAINSLPSSSLSEGYSTLLSIPTDHRYKLIWLFSIYPPIFENYSLTMAQSFYYRVPAIGY